MLVMVLGVAHCDVVSLPRPPRVSIPIESTLSISLFGDVREGAFSE